MPLRSLAATAPWDVIAEALGIPEGHARDEYETINIAVLASREDEMHALIKTMVDAP